MFKKYRNLWLALGAFIILTPLGLIASGTAFGEWGVDQMEEEVGFIPAGLERMADLWSHAPLADYGIAGFDASFMQSAVGYIFSAVVGVALVVGISMLLSKIVQE
ncbi:MAG: PDGLE domain-containing protein [Syntrophomonas sp.]|nr:PDGLE domain-containing protein [Syntrophomonas sp.]